MGIPMFQKAQSFDVTLNAWHFASFGTEQGLEEKPWARSHDQKPES